MNTTCLADRTVPGELLRQVADGLAGAGLDVRPPADADGSRLDITLPGARCTLAVGEGGSAEWAYWPWSADDADPGLTAFDVFAEIVVTVPGPGDGGGQVCVADDGGLTWTRDYLVEAAALSGSGLVGQAADPVGIAGLVVEAVTRAMALLRPAGAGRAGDG